MTMRETLYFHMYHPHRSRLAPAGCTIVKLPDMDNFFTGTTGLVSKELRHRDAHFDRG